MDSTRLASCSITSLALLNRRKKREIFYCTTKLIRRDYHYPGNTSNKYAFSVNVSSDNKLWVGTFNGPWTNGCEIWCYNGTDWVSIVKDEDGELPNGFHDILNSGARSMIEYPKDSNKIVIGTFRGSAQGLWEGFLELINLGEGIGGCEVWMRYGGPS